MSAPGVSERDRLLAALKKEDWPTLRQAGWLDAFQGLLNWKQFEDGRPVDRVPARKCERLLALLGDFPADRVLDALGQHVRGPNGLNEPSAAELYQFVAGAPGPAGKAGPGTRPESAPDTLRLVAGLLDGGAESRCECSPRPAEFHWDRESHPGHLVVWCPDCGCIEAGQATEAEYLVRPYVDGRDPVLDLSAAVRFRRVRAARGDAR